MIKINFMHRNNAKLDIKYKYYQYRILISIIFGYAAYYLCRQNFSVIMPVIMGEFNYSKTTIGYILTISSIIYGVGKFVNGYISDRSDARYFMSLGLFLTAFVSFVLGFSGDIFILGLLWFLNNWFQSMGWPPAARMLTHWFPKRNMGLTWAIGAASHQVGGALSLIFVAYIISIYSWRVGFFIPAIISAFVSYLLYLLLRDSPSELGLEPIELYAKRKYNDEILNKQERQDLKHSHLETSKIFKRVFVNKDIWYIGIANMFLYIVRGGVLAWGPLFLQETKDVNLQLASYQVAAYEVTGLLGGIFAGFLSDRFFHRNRSIIAGIFMFMLGIIITIFWLADSFSLFVNICLFMFIGFFVYGPQILVGVLCADFAGSKAVGSANGLVGTMGYVGLALAGCVIGNLSDMYGWGSVMVFFIISAFLSSLFFILTLKSKKFYHKK